MKHAPLLTATVQRVLGRASVGVAERNQKTGPQEPEQAGDLDDLA